MTNNKTAELEASVMLEELDDAALETVVGGIGLPGVVTTLVSGLGALLLILGPQVGSLLGGILGGLQNGDS